ncbi:MAG: hypothetical protein JXB85_02635 [Anaerolineales bacterium]|nr:hypothetical protein [Anaerolineales bacterium]
MPDYLYLIHPLRDGFFEQPTPAESIMMEQHFAYLKQAAEAGQVLLAGPCLDDTFGLVVFRAENDEAANAFMFADPSVRQNVMVAELHPLRISLLGKPRPTGD